MKNILLFCALLITQTAFTQVKLCRLFSDHAVLQRQKPLPVWGSAQPNEAITVNLAGQIQKTTADTEGVWRVTFTPFEAGGPFKLTVEAGSDTVSVSDILFGEVWLCSGQSNMEFSWFLFCKRHLSKNECANWHFTFVMGRFTNRKLDKQRGDANV